CVAGITTFRFSEMKVHVKILTTPDIPVGTLFQRHSACRRSLLLMSDHAPARRRVNRISSSHIATSPVPTTLSCTSSKQPPPLERLRISSGREAWGRRGQDRLAVDLCP